jgi:hypothetical protein
MGITGFDGRPVTKGSKGSKLDSRVSDDSVPDGDSDSPTMDIGWNLKDRPSLGKTGGRLVAPSLGEKGGDWSHRFPLGNGKLGQRNWVPLGSRKENPGQGN